ncbi:hypothetical protein F4776DRAFT_615672, partial [Hypoxylon sp. NC0597]
MLSRLNQRRRVMIGGVCPALLLRCSLVLTIGIVDDVEPSKSQRGVLSSWEGIHMTQPQFDLSCSYLHTMYTMYYDMIPIRSLMYNLQS